MKLDALTTYIGVNTRMCGLNLYAILDARVREKTPFG